MPWKPGDFFQKQDWAIYKERPISYSKREFDSSGREGYQEYNSLQDSNLRTFYSNDRNLKRLKENGEITQANDVICNLKEFNQHRQKLHKSQLCYNLNELKRMQDERHDRMLISNAEYITSCDQGNLIARQHSYDAVMRRKSLVDQQKMQRLKRLLAMTEDKVTFIKNTHTTKLISLEHKKVQGQLRIKQHWDKRNDIQRKQLISLKKLLQVKKDRLRKNTLKQAESRDQKVQEKQTRSWNKRLAERIANQDKVRILLKEADYQRRNFIENHKAQYKQKWMRIHQEIKRRALLNKRKRDPLMSTNKIAPLSPPSAEEFQGTFERLLDGDVCKALNTALDLEDNIKTPFAADDPIYKAAQFILQHILTKFHKDMSSDKGAYKSVYGRIDNFFEEASKFVMFRATQIIAAARETVPICRSSRTCKIARNDFEHPALKQASLGRVSFSKMSSTIGISSYAIHPLIEVRDVGDRRPTPAGSLASIVVDSTTSLAQKTQSTHLCRNELVFIEHYVTKFKRELIVGIGRRVFAAIQCHFENRIMNVRQELLEIDRKFLVKQTAKSILRYSINPLDFESNLRLCINALSSNVVCSLQNVLLKTTRDPRRPAKPHLCCHCKHATQWNFGTCAPTVNDCS